MVRLVNANFLKAVEFTHTALEQVIQKSCFDAMAWTRGGEEKPGLHVRHEQEPPLRMGAAWRNLRLAHWSMGRAADGDDVLEHHSSYEERQGALPQLHDQ
eukprot:14791060-Heterocapsa_arctica.AAC.1